MSNKFLIKNPLCSIALRASAFSIYMPAKTNKLNVFLIKPGITTFNKIVVQEAQAIEIEGIGTFYAEPSRPRPPDWIKDFFGSSFSIGTLKLVSSSAKGLLLVKIRQNQKNYIFAVTFGYGRYLLQDDVIEEQFGLKTVLNSVDHKFIRGVDKTSLGSTPKQSREQMSREADVADFGLDVEQDLVSSVTGKSRFPVFGRTVSGRDGFSVSAKVNSSNIKEFLVECLNRYLSQEYKENFGWIDHIKTVRDDKIITKLDKKIEATITEAQLDKIWMAAPEILDWATISGFRYQQPKRGQLRTDLDLREFIEFLGDRPASIVTLKETMVHVISAATDESTTHWSAYRCLCAEVNHNNTVYVLNAGKWYEIIRDFSAQVQQSFDTLPECTIQFPD